MPAAQHHSASSRLATSALRGYADGMTDEPRPQRTPLLVWAIAVFGAVAIHAGCIAMALQYARADDDEALGAPAIEIGVELASPRIDPTNLPPGPESEAAAASPEVPQQQAVVDPTLLPKAIPIETDDPERVVTPEESHKPRPDEPKIAAIETAPSLPSVAAEETAPTAIETPVVATRSIAPAPGTGDSARRVRASWEKELAAHFDKHKRYPTDRSNRNVEIMIKFELDRTGHILSGTVAQSSGDPSFDEAALAMLRRADPVPPPPPLVADEGLRFSLPVIFRVRERN
jgi:protein TonB